MAPVTALRDFLKKKSRLRAFRAFLLKEFSDENLDFYLEIESYKKQKQSRQLKLAPAIYVTYIQAGASRELNLDSVIRRKTEQKLADPDSTTFDLAQEHVIELMEKDSYQRFLCAHLSSFFCDQRSSSNSRTLSVDEKPAAPSRFSFSLRMLSTEKKSIKPTFA